MDGEDGVAAAEATGAGDHRTEVAEAVTAGAAEGHRTVAEGHRTAAAGEGATAEAGDLRTEAAGVDTAGAAEGRRMAAAGGVPTEVVAEAVTAGGAGPRTVGPAAATAAGPLTAGGGTPIGRRAVSCRSG